MAPSPREADPELQIEMNRVAEAVEKTIGHLLPETELAENRLFQAMRHGTLSGGKRLRPFLTMHTANLFNVDPVRARRVAAAVEFVHCYSLIHDDLPAMDDAKLRRGKPTVHIQFDEATAILAGDALLTLAFEVLSEPETHEDPRVRCELVRSLAKAAGGHGMAGGQMLDLIGEREEFDLGTISRLQRMKTGKLMAFACEAGVILGKGGEPHRKALCNYAFDLGLAFQVTDDILDVEADPQDTGKDTRKDSQAGKSTFVSTMGKEQAKNRAEILVRQAIGHLKIFDGRAEKLQRLAQYVLERRA
ncbi:MAG: polyprenyl synthetase family protein [Alphaproteobacteria bacterium]|nr:polyprenyl synthetase family protein [Alphaproteobacteria bacterium]MBP7758816.1 polyprenyl synthetase family protein [Alphaproteobacteria bacterium]MBP7762110.1 polyprenyl synthetase family protein [Alphaproteobacteria bacterium]MBP7904123.1 polyprenyl synthetase family protein [Alphaproteobacteria bacterium]